MICGIGRMLVTAIFAKPEPVVMGPGFRRDDIEGYAFNFPWKVASTAPSASRPCMG